MQCIDKHIGHLISLYEFGQLSDEQKRLFEAHVVDCDFCFQSLLELSPAIETMRDQPEVFLAALRQSARTPVSKRVKDWITRTLGTLEVPVWGKVALPIAAAFAVFLIMRTQPSGELSHLARIEPVPYFTFQLKGGSETSEAEQWFADGMQLYVEGKYELAAAKLSRAVELTPDNMSFQFYLGLSHLLAGRAEGAIVHLEQVVEHGPSLLRERAHWYLGNAYLLAEDGKRALEEFELVVALEGEYEWEARDLVEAIKDQAARPD